MPNSKDQIIVAEDRHQLAVFGADIFKKAALDAVEHFDTFKVAISGGSSPRLMNRLLVKDPYHHMIPWIDTHIFWVDERLLPATDPDSNYGTARKDFLAQIQIPPENIHPMCSEKKPREAADAYQQQIINFFNPSFGKIPIFDLIFLGIGTDGHTASIFPGDKTAIETDRWVCAVKGGHPNVDRLTLILPLINQARCIVILASGQKKSEIIQTIFMNKGANLPIQKIKPISGRLIWLLDKDAAARLPDYNRD